MIGITLVVFREEGLWFAIGLEYGVPAQGNTIQDAIEAYSLQFYSYMTMSKGLDKELMHGFEKAPQIYWDMIA